MMIPKLFAALTRKKTINENRESKLARVLTLVDLVALGVGSTLGLGVYVLAGSVAKTVAGPAVCLSFLVAAVASAVAGLCYAEFAARVPHAGSAYVYSYISVGEFVAYVIGLNLILEYVIGTASVARGLSNYIDALAERKIRDTFRQWLPIDVSFLSPYPDFLAFVFVLLLTGILAFGVKESSRLNNLFSVLNLATISVAIVAGSIKADPNNWKLTADQIEAEYQDSAGTGGFAPFGFAGIMAGAAKCFYGFVGFDAIATTGEEAKNPQRDIPLALVISLLIIFAAYFSISTVLTMMWPYYLQDADAPFPYAFGQINWITIKWIITIGAIFALCTSMLGAMFPLPRVIYAMSSDGVIFKGLAKVNSWTKTPVRATVLSGVLSAIMTLIFDLEQLIDMMSIGTLLAYTLVAISVLILRYQCKTILYPQIEVTEDTNWSILTFFKDIFNLNNIKSPTKLTSRIVYWSIAIFSVFTCFLSASFIYGYEQIVTQNDPLLTSALAVFVVVMVLLFIIIARQPVNKEKLSFKVPLVPLIPCLSVIFNLYLMFQLDYFTWIRFLVWLVVGFVIYFSYGIGHSEENKTVNKIISFSNEAPVSSSNSKIENKGKR